MGLCAAYDNKTKNPKGHRILKKIIALAYLPPTNIIEGLEIIEKEAMELGQEQSTTAAWTKFFSYFRKEWITIVKPENFSVIHALYRTNNFIERWHKYLNMEMGCKPTVKKFIGI